MGTTWYFAEGATHSGFQLFYLFQNPNATSVDVDVTYLRPNKLPFTKRYTVGPNSRMNVWVNKEDSRLSWTDVSAAIVSTAPIVAERSMYLNARGKLFGAGHASAGVTRASTSWFLAEGATGDFFDLFVLIANSTASAADVRVTYLLQGGGTIERAYRVAGRSRFTIWVDQEDARLANASVSTLVQSTNDVPIIVERAMWWPGPTASTWYEASDRRAQHARRRGGPGRWRDRRHGRRGNLHPHREHLRVDGEARVTFYFEDGTSVQRVFPLAARSRTNVAVGAPTELGGFGDAVTNRRFGAVVEGRALTSEGTAPQIIVERAMYWNASGVSWAAGTNALGTKLQ